MMRPWSRIARWSPRTKFIVGSILLVLLSFGGWKGYETYDYIQHDNDFCFSCHLMQEPFQRFAESGHRYLSCKACHRPTLIERSQMAMTSVIDRPTEIHKHAKVPNALCAECHIEGDPDQWKVIAATAGHRVHFESDREELQGLMCVECHSAAIHDFVPLSRTCAQAGCHVDSSIELGGMSALNELHCVACHDFLADERDWTSPELTPRQKDCLACHEMQALVENDDFHSDPHKAKCADCHNPHTQHEAREASASCATVGCHDAPQELTAYHRGIENAADCLQCHQAHQWTLESPTCQGCHNEVDLTVASWLGGSTFDHGRHRKLDCSSCHDAEPTHGHASVTTVSDCANCHHAPSSDLTCRTCHADLDGMVPTTQTVRLSVWEQPRVRNLDFSHDNHQSLDCSKCHSETPYTAPAVDCASCHADHHSAEVTACAHCHGDQARSQHEVDSHLGCSGASCHTNSPVNFAARPTCLSCHVDQVDHEPDGDCVACHFPAHESATKGTGR